MGRNGWWRGILIGFLRFAPFFFLYSIPPFHAFQIAFLAVNSNREIRSVLSYSRARANFTARWYKRDISISHWLFASFAYCLCPFLRERGSRTRDNSIPIQGDGKVPTSARPTRTLRFEAMSRVTNPRNPLCHEAPFARTRNPLCTASEETRVHSIRYRSTRIHSLLSINRFSHDLYLLNLYLLPPLIVVLRRQI